MNPHSMFMLVSLVFAVATPRYAGATEFHVFYLGGQSNMDGFGYVEELPSELRDTNGAVPIFHGDPSADQQTGGGMGRWTKLKPGHGVGFRSGSETTHYSDRFGVELSFAKRLQELFPDRRIALIKYSRGGTSIASEAAGYSDKWHYDSEGYLHLGREFADQFAGIDADGDGTR